jgi:hypothetical protein
MVLGGVVCVIGVPTTEHARQQQTHSRPNKTRLDCIICFTLLYLGTIRIERERERERERDPQKSVELPETVPVCHRRPCQRQPQMKKESLFHENVLTAP